MRRVLTLALVGGLAAGLSACDSLRSSAGLGKDTPDEFAVVTKAPLVIPPDFNLRPPAPGAAAANQVEPTNAAQSALFSADPATVAASMPATMSNGERYLLANARVQDADPAIRQQIAADIGMRGSDDSFTNSLLFSGSTPVAAPLDADAEARRLDAARAAGSTVGTAPPQAPSQAPAAPPPPPPSDKDDGWLSGLWPF